MDKLAPEVWAELPQYDVWDNPLPARDDFISCWDSVERPLTPVVTPNDALTLARAWSLSSERWSHPSDSDYRQIVSMCFWLARLCRNGGRFFVSCRRAAKAVETGRTHAAQLLRRAVSEGLLEEERKGSRVTGASVYRFDLTTVEIVSPQEP